MHKLPPITLEQMTVFVAVIEHGSFTAAARALRIPVSNASRKIAALEDVLDAQLIRRTTRALTPTDAGARFLRHCRDALSTIESAIGEIDGDSKDVRGRVRVSAPVELGMAILGPVAVDVLRAHPGVALEIALSERRIDLAHEGFDVAIRVGRLPDSGLRARKLTDVNMWLCASPGYLDTHGIPGRPGDLEKHVCVLSGPRDRAPVWTFTRGTRQIDVRPSGSLVVNSFHLARDAAVAGLGICALPTYAIGDEMRAGTLTRILAGWSLPAIPVHAVHAEERRPSPAVRAFLDALIERLVTHADQEQRARHPRQV
jgi:DNA-binding transcriptional LysR family regulator